MPGLIRSIFGVLLTFDVLSAYAESTMHVAAMHFPAWLVRNHQNLPLEPGTAVLFKLRNQPLLPLDVIDLRQHQLWIAETELKSERDLVIADGQWQPVLISLTEAKLAQQVLADFRQQGFAARSKTVVRQGRTLHRLLLPGFESIDAARNAASRIEQTLGISDAWVWKQPDS